MHAQMCAHEHTQIYLPGNIQINSKIYKVLCIFNIIRKWERLLKHILINKLF